MGKLNNVKAAVSRAAGKTKFWTIQHSPELLLAAGIGTGVACVVLACKATAKSMPIIEEAKDVLEKMEDAEATKDFEEAKAKLREEEGIDVSDDFANEFSGKTKRQVILHTTGKVSKNYIPAATCGIISVGCVLASYKILDKRLVGATVAYEILDAKFNKYRKRVIEKFGDEVESEIYYGKDTVKKKVRKILDEDGVEHEEELEEFEPNIEKDVPWHSIYAVHYTNKSRQPHMDWLQLKTLQNYFNEQLSINGYVLLNDIYKELGIPQNGDFVGIGWVSNDYLEIEGKNRGDGFIDFGLFGEHVSEQAAKWRDGEMDEVIIDFNVDGPIYKLMNTINKLNREDYELYKTDMAAFYREPKKRPYHV